MTGVTANYLDIFVKNEQNVPTGSTTTIAAPYNWLVMTNPSTTAAQTVVLPSNPTDGQIVVLSNLAQITALTFSPAVSGYSNGGQLTAGTGLWLAYSSNLGAWFVMNY